jgi:Zn-dependent protease with chaperone function
MAKSGATGQVFNAEMHKARVLMIAERVQADMHMEFWDIEHQFHDGVYEDHLQEDEYSTTMACTVTRWPYRLARIQWFLGTVARCDDDNVEDVMEHELAHVLLGPMHAAMKTGKEDQEEMATENVAKVIKALRGRNK